MAANRAGHEKEATKKDSALMPRPFDSNFGWPLPPRASTGYSPSITGRFPPNDPVPCEKLRNVLDGRRPEGAGAGGGNLFSSF